MATHRRTVARAIASALPLRTNLRESAAQSAWRPPTASDGEGSPAKEVQPVDPKERPATA
eukprot:3492210-Prymnesium_polylepis.1